MGCKEHVKNQVKIGIRINVKFRAFGVTFGYAKQSFNLSHDGTNFTVDSTGDPTDTLVITIYDNHGVKVECWPVL